MQGPTRVGGGKHTLHPTGTRQVDDDTAFMPGFFVWLLGACLLLDEICLSNRVRDNLHVVLAMSPIGESFRNRTRMYPGLVNCTTIDWFQPWPADALVEVATKFIQDIPVRQRGRQFYRDVLLVVTAVLYLLFTVCATGLQ